jgi:hypothetical protein
MESARSVVNSGDIVRGGSLLQDPIGLIGSTDAALPKGNSEIHSSGKSVEGATSS